MNKEGNSVKRDIAIAAIVIGIFYLALFILNLISAVSENSQEARHAEQIGQPLTEQVSAFSTAVNQTVGSIYGLIDVLNILAVVAVGGLLGWLVMRWGFRNTLGRDFGSVFNDGWAAMDPAAKTRWIIIVWLVIFFAVVHGRASASEYPWAGPDVIEENVSLPISHEARDMIIYYEVGGKSYYEKRLTKPTVPAWRSTASGVTVGFGVDVGHMTDAQIDAAFTGIIPSSMITSLKGVNGLKGRSAYYNGLPKVRHVVRVTWDQATKVFERDTLPRFTEQTKTAFRLPYLRLHPHENGALVSLVFNRGPSMSSSSSRLEMRQIRDDIATGWAGRVPSRIRSMKRLWSYTKLRGLHLRRDAEARLFEKGSRTRLL